MMINCKVFRFSAQEEDPTGEVKMIGGYKLLNKVLGSSVSRSAESNTN